jgi:hypothetical protein
MAGANAGRTECFYLTKLSCFDFTALFVESVWKPYLKNFAPEPFFENSFISFIL